MSPSEAPQPEKVGTLAQSAHSSLGAWELGSLGAWELGSLGAWELRLRNHRIVEHRRLSQKQDVLGHERLLPKYATVHRIQLSIYPLQFSEKILQGNINRTGDSAGSLET